ncbi:MAG: ABC transporter permease [Hyphomicrobiales bacterium]
MKKTLFENIRIAGEAIKSHVLRTILTVLIIGIGIMALVGILTAIDSVNYYLKENFAQAGSNTFSIKNRELRGAFVGPRGKRQRFSPITYEQSLDFVQRYDFPSVVSLSSVGTSIATVKYKSEKTDPNIRIIGTDDNYLESKGLELMSGRNFSDQELKYGSFICVIGNDIIDELFKKNEDPIGKYINIGPGRYLVVGVLEKKGSSFGFSFDQTCLIPLNNLRQNYYSPSRSFTLDVTVPNSAQLDAAIGEATSTFRIIREDKIGTSDSFVINKSDALLKVLNENTASIVVGATVIGLITLLGAAIGLMNIMLVSVTERTKEIGVRKAIGANNITIRNQFLVEAILISQMGGVVGVILGLLIGNTVSILIGSTFLIPWKWIILAFVICLIVAIVSGIHPAIKASKLDPIESLRYE